MIIFNEDDDNKVRKIFEEFSRFGGREKFYVEERPAVLVLEMNAQEITIQKYPKR